MPAVVDDVNVKLVVLVVLQRAAKPRNCGARVRLHVFGRVLHVIWLVDAPRYSSVCGLLGAIDAVRRQHGARLISTLGQLRLDLCGRQPAVAPDLVCEQVGDRGFSRKVQSTRHNRFDKGCHGNPSVVSTAASATEFYGKFLKQVLNIRVGHIPNAERTRRADGSLEV